LAVEVITYVALFFSTEAFGLTSKSSDARDTEMNYNLKMNRKRWVP
jgi:hypothetical protein